MSNENNLEEITAAHEAARTERRNLGNELAEIDDERATAVAAGDAVALSRLGKRKRELPFLIGESGAIENSLSNKEFSARQSGPIAKIPGAEKALEDAKRTIARRKFEHEQELASLQSVVLVAEREVRDLYNECSALGDIYGPRNIRFKEELARLNS
jgi:hypothetical protein